MRCVRGDSASRRADFIIASSPGLQRGVIAVLAAPADSALLFSDEVATQAAADQRAQEMGNHGKEKIRGFRASWRIHGEEPPWSVGREVPHCLHYDGAGFCPPGLCEPQFSL